MAALALALALTLVATLVADHATLPAIWGMPHLALTLTQGLTAAAHATAIPRPSCLGRAHCDEAGRCQGKEQGREIE